jgi:hypothetical protein
VKFDIILLAFRDFCSFHLQVEGTGIAGKSSA